MMHYTRAVNGMMKYVDEEIISKMAGGWKSWLVGTMAGVIGSKAELMMREYANNPTLKKLGIIDGENLDVELIYNELRKQAGKGNVTANFPIVGAITFDQHDVDKLYQYMLEG